MSFLLIILASLMTLLLYAMAEIVKKKGEDL